jgi:hypothetical protein
MQITFYPKRLLATAVIAVAMWLVLTLALAKPVSGVIFITACVAAGVFFDLFFYVNPALWGRWRRLR